MKTNNLPLLCDVILLPAEKKQPKDHVNSLFLNDANVLSYLTSIEDVIKSYYFFKAQPQFLYFISNRRIISGDYYFNQVTGRIHRADDETITMLVFKKIEASTDSSLFGVTPIHIDDIIHYEQHFNNNFKIIQYAIEFVGNTDEGYLKLREDGTVIITEPIQPKESSTAMSDLINHISEHKKNLTIKEIYMICLNLITKERDLIEAAYNAGVKNAHTLHYADGADYYRKNYMVFTHMDITSSSE